MRFGVVQQPGGQGGSSGGDRRFVPTLARAAVAVAMVKQAAMSIFSDMLDLVSWINLSAISVKSCVPYRSASSLIDAIKNEPASD